MEPPSNRLNRFIDELKRRKVFRVIGMYAATAFIIIEAGDIILPRLGLPDWTVTLVIILVLLGKYNGMSQFDTIVTDIHSPRARDHLCHEVLLAVAKTALGCVFPVLILFVSHD